MRTPPISEKRRPRVLCSCWACVLLVPSSGSIEGHGNWHPQPHSDLLHAELLAHPAPTVPTQQGQGVLCQDSMLHYWADCTTIWLLLMCFYLLLMSFILLLLVLIFALPSPVCRLVSYLVGSTTLYPIISFILSPPTPYFSFFFLFPFVFFFWVILMVMFYLNSCVSLLSVSVYFTWPHHHLTALLYLYMCACKC